MPGNVPRDATKDADKAGPGPAEQAEAAPDRRRKLYSTRTETRQADTPVKVVRAPPPDRGARRGLPAPPLPEHHRARLRERRRRKDLAAAQPGGDPGGPGALAEPAEPTEPTESRRMKAANASR